jgi:Uma2 family endonuclease
MSALPEPPKQLLTIDDYIALGEDARGRWELQEGSLVMSPSPAPGHMIAIRRLCGQLEEQLPGHVELVPDVDFDLQLAKPPDPGSARRPDLVVVERAEVDRVDAEGGMLRASETHLVVEIASPGSKRMDYLIKRREYADAGIPHYWVVNLATGPSLLARRLAGEASYTARDEATGTFVTDEPFPMTVQLGRLT